MAKSAGERLKAGMDSDLEHAAEQAGAPLVFSGQDLELIAEAARCADRAEQLQARYDAELSKGDDADVQALTKLASESRLQGNQVAVLLRRVKVDPPAPKSEQHVRAARSRWDRRA